MSLYQKAFFSGVARIFTLPRLSIPLILTLGLTLGAVLTVASMSNTLLLQPLSGVKNEKDILAYDIKLQMSEKLIIPFFSFRHLHDIQNYFSDAGTWAGISANHQVSVDIDNVGFMVTEVAAAPTTLDVLGSRLLLGDSFNITDPERYVWISESLWNNAFNGQKEVIGKLLPVAGKDKIIAGVVQDVLAIPTKKRVLSQQIWKVADLDKAAAKPETGSVGGEIDTLLLLANKTAAAPGPEELQAWQNQYLENNLPAQNAAFFKQWMAQMQTQTKMSGYRDAMLGSTTTLLTTLTFAVVGLLIMAVLNLLNMYIAHYQTRAKEFAIQLTTGASQWKLRSLIWLENLPLFLLSAVTGLLATGWLLKLLPTLAEDVLPLLEALRIDGFVIAMSLVSILVINTLFSVFALMHLNKQQLASNLAHSGKGSQAQTGGMASKGLMVLQLGLASVLLTATIMLAMQSYHAVYQDLGYDFSNTYEISVDVGEQLPGTFSLAEQAAQHESRRLRDEEISQVIEQTINGSEVVSASNGPLSGSIAIHTVSDDERPEPLMFAVNQLSADYFDAFSIPFLAGSNLTQAQIDDKAKRIVVDELLAKQLFPNLSLEEVVGKSYPFTGGKDAEPEVIQGVVASTLSTAGQVNNQPMATLYRAGESNFAPTFAVKVPEGVKVDESILSKAIMAALPTAKSVNVMSLEFLWQVQTKTQRMSLWVIVSVAALTIFLAVLGISGLTQMTTNQRKFELAIRMATGAKQSRLVRFILKDSVWMLALGLGLGFVASVFVYQELEALLDMFPAFNVWLVTGLDVGLIVIVLLSIGWPAWRVIKQDPMQALREE